MSTVGAAAERPRRALRARRGDRSGPLEVRHDQGPWRVPCEAGGGGAWYPPSVDGGDVYWGTANPYPCGGTRAHPNGGAYAGPALYTDSLLVLDARAARSSGTTR